MKKRIFIITILSIAMLTACNESGKTNDISKNGQDKKQAEKLEINTKKNSDKEEEAKEEKETPVSYTHLDIFCFQTWKKMI